MLPICPGRTSEGLAERETAILLDLADERGDLISRFVEREMSRFQKMNFRARHIVRIGCRPGDGEGRIVSSPDHQYVRLDLAKPLLPTRIGGDVGSIVRKQCGLDVALAWTGEKRVLVCPCIRIVAFGMWAGPDVALPRRFGRREIGF